MNRLEGRSAIVTGGARGIGLAIVERLAAEGAQVTFCDLGASAGDQALRELTRTGIAASFVQADVTREADVERLVSGVAERHGSVDILVNNAGINAYFDASTMTEAEWDSVFAVDLKGAWLCAKHALASMRPARRGSIVNIASIHAQMTIAGMFPYAAAKAGLVGLTRSLALDCAPLNIRVNAVLPGYTRTRLVEEWLSLQPDPAAAERRVHESIPAGRMASPAEIASVVAFLASDDAAFITGQVISVSGGLTMAG